LSQVPADWNLTCFTFADPKDQAKVDSAAHLILLSCICPSSLAGKSLKLVHTGVVIA
jgi:hypothetical protein